MTAYKAFISYSHADSRWARWLQQALETYKLPRPLHEHHSVKPVFLDREAFAASADLSQSIVTKLQASENLIVVCSPSAASSPWVNQEIETFIALGRADRIFCLFVDGAPYSADKECLPQALRSADQQEPLAADVRQNGDGRKLAIVKLVAAVLDVDLEQLRRRDIQRRQRTLALVTSASFAGMCVLAALSAFAFLSRNEALAAKAESELRQRQAEELIGFMLGDLREKLETVGRLDILRDVGTKATEYFASVPTDMLQDEELHQRAKAIRQFGVDQFTEGELDNAMSIFNEALALDSALYRRAPESAAWGIALADDHYWIGVIHYQKDQLEAALKSFLSQRSAIADVVDRFPGNEEVRSNLAYVSNNIGMIYRQSGMLDEALEFLSTARSMLLDIADGSSDVEEARSAIDVSVAVGELQWRVGQLSEADKILTRAVDLGRGLLAEVPSNVLVMGSQTSALAYLRQVKESIGNQPQIELAKEQLELSSRRHDIDPTIVQAKRDLAIARIVVARILSLTGQQSVAREEIAQSLAILFELSSDEPNDQHLQRDVIRARLDLAEMLVQLGELEAAEQSLNAALAGLNSPREDSSPDYESSLLKWRGALLAGNILQHRGETLRAENACGEAVNDLDRSELPGLKADSRVLRLKTRLLFCLNEITLGQQFLQKLEARGFSAANILQQQVPALRR